MEKTPLTRIIFSLLLLLFKGFVKLSNNHIYIAGGYFLILYAIYAFTLPDKQVFVSAIIDFLIHFGVFYTIWKFILKQYYHPKLPGKFLGYTALTIVVAGIISLYDVYLFPTDFALDDVANSEVDFSMLTRRFLLHCTPITFIALASTIYGLSNFKTQETEKNSLELNAENKFLNYQINPHFLFNSLNNIYSKSILKPEGVSNSIFELSELLSYTLYSSEKKSVSLEEEITHIEHFINMMKLKDSSVNNISFDYEKVDQALQISPMLLIPFIENAFKHGNISQSEDGWIKIKMATTRGAMFFQCHNSTDQVERSKDAVGGIGISNVRRRLEIIYPKKHQLSTVPLKDTYAVELNLDLT